MTDNELAEIKRIWELEALRNPKFTDYREVNSPAIKISGMKVFLERVLSNLKVVVLLRNDNDFESFVRDKLTEDIATKKLRFSNCILLFNPNMGLILRQI